MSMISNEFSKNIFIIPTKKKKLINKNNPFNKKMVFLYFNINEKNDKIDIQNIDIAK